jgi:hypothetical protein
MRSLRAVRVRQQQTHESHHRSQLTRTEEDALIDQLFQQLYLLRELLLLAIAFERGEIMSKVNQNEMAGVRWAIRDEAGAKPLGGEGVGVGAGGLVERDVFGERRGGEERGPHSVLVSVKVEEQAVSKRYGGSKRVKIQTHGRRADLHGPCGGRETPVELRIMLTHHYSYPETVRAKVLRRAWRKKISKSRAREQDEEGVP